MAITKLVLDRQAEGRVFPFGTTTANGEALVTLNKGTAAVTTVVLDVKGSQSIAGDLNLTGDLNVTGSINSVSVTNTNVKDLTITLNDGGTTASAANSGLLVEGDTNSVIGSLLFDNSLTSKWKIGDGTTQVEIVTVSGAQTLTNKSIGGAQITGAVALATTVTTNANLTGIVTSVGNATSIADGAIAISKLANIATNTLVGRSTAGTGAVEVITVGTGLTLSGGVLSSSNGGTVTSVSIVSANGVSGTVANASTTPAITLTLGAITPTSVNGNTISTGTGTLALSTFTLTATGTASISGTHTGTSSGTNTGDQTITLTGDVTGSGTGSFATTLTTYQRKATVSGTQDSANKIFTIGAALKAGSDQVYLNGILLDSGASNDYVYDGNVTFTFQAGFTAPSSTDKITIHGTF